ncbi:hypothetical protein ABR737_01250 [Streptomyces sp. Edi2]|uniref:hypothetical protein n=1 Tax=Streptomyces sp. Edi2 TaxID=3162528 RepID=UPI003305BDCF
MTKKRTTSQQRARELQARHPGLSLSEALALVRSGSLTEPVTADAARQALRAVVADASVHDSWRERFRGWLVGAAADDWPTPQVCVEFCSDLHALAGESEVLDPERLRVPMAMTDMLLPQVQRAIGDMARLAGRRSYQNWFGVQPPCGAGRIWEAEGPWHAASQRYVFAVAAALDGPLRPLLRHGFGVLSAVPDVVYGIRPVAGHRSQRTMWIYTPDGLRIRSVPYPRPWGTEAVHGSFSVRTLGDRVLAARALLSDALGGTAPPAQASCSGCQGTGWLETEDADHAVHRPHYHPANSSMAQTCLCGACRGTGLRGLPAREFAERFLTPLAPSWTMARSDVLSWAATRTARDARRDLLSCAPGLQIGYADAVVRALARAGFPVDITCEADGGEGWGVDFDTAGHLGAWVLLPGHPAPAHPDSDGTFLAWSSDRGWSSSPHHADPSVPMSTRLRHPPRALCPGILVPAPDEVARALGKASLDATAGEVRWVRPADFHADAYSQVLAYLS